MRRSPRRGTPIRGCSAARRPDVRISCREAPHEAGDRGRCRPRRVGEPRFPKPLHQHGDRAASRGRRFRRAMRSYFEHEIIDSEQITPALHRKRATLWRRLKWTVSYWLVTRWTTRSPAAELQGAHRVVPPFAVLFFHAQNKAGRRNVDPLETAIDLVEVGLDEVEHLRAELVDEEGAARAYDLRRRLRDRVANARRKRREGQAGQHKVRFRKAAIFEVSSRRRPPSRSRARAAGPRSTPSDSA